MNRNKPGLNNSLSCNLEIFRSTVYSSKRTMFHLLLSLTQPVFVGNSNSLEDKYHGRVFPQQFFLFYGNLSLLFPAVGRYYCLFWSRRRTVSFSQHKTVYPALFPLFSTKIPTKYRVFFSFYPPIKVKKVE